MLNLVKRETMQGKSAQNGKTVLDTVANNSLANLTKMGALSATVFLLPPLLVRVLDKPTYATWILILQIGTYVALIDGSIQLAISRFVARSRGLQDDRYMAQMLSSAGLIMLAIGLFTALLTLMGSWQLDRLFPGIPQSLGTDARWALLILGMSLAISIPFSTFAGAFLGLQKHEINAVAGSVGRLAGAAGVAWAAYHHERLYVMAIWMATGNLLQGLMYLLAWMRFGMSNLLSVANVKWSAINEFLNFCYAIFATQLGAVLITGLDMPIVAAFDFHSAAYYAVAATVSTMISVPQAAIVNTLIPVASNIGATGSPERLGHVVLKTTRYATAILCLIVLPALLGMYSFLRVWVGVDYARHALPIAILLVIAQFVRLTLLPYAAIGFAAGQLNQMLISPVGEGIMNLLCSLIGVHFFGAIGVALGTLIGACFGVLLHFINSMPRTNSMTFSRAGLALNGILKPISLCFPALLLVYFLASHLISSFIIALLICFAEILAVLTLWNLNFNVQERKQLTTLITGMTRRLLIGRFYKATIL